MNSLLKFTFSDRPLLTMCVCSFWGVTVGVAVIWNSISKFIDIHEVNKHITFRNDSGARKELISPYNFLPFYLPEVYKDIDRFIYLDSDIVVKVWDGKTILVIFSLSLSLFLCVCFNPVVEKSSTRDSLVNGLWYFDSLIFWGLGFGMLNTPFASSCRVTLRISTIQILKAMLQLQLKTVPRDLQSTLTLPN